MVVPFKPVGLHFLFLFTIMDILWKSILGSVVVGVFLSRIYHLCMNVDLVCVKLSVITSIPSVKIFYN
jgi:hypothetical protein